MNRIRAASVTLALAAGLSGGLAVAADPPTKPRKPPVVVAPLAADVLAEAVRAEQDAYIRRLDVCTKLRQIADEKGDTDLASKADELEKLATAVYQERVGKLGVKPTKAAAGFGPTSVDPLAVAAPKPASAPREVKP